jgi:hypothetical protein
MIRLPRIAMTAAASLIGLIAARVRGTARIVRRKPRAKLSPLRSRVHHRANRDPPLSQAQEGSWNPLAARAYASGSFCSAMEDFVMLRHGSFFNRCIASFM